MSPRASRAIPMPSGTEDVTAVGRLPACPGSRIKGASMVEDSPRAPGVDAQLASQWAQVRGRLRSEFGEATFRSWLKPLTLIGQHESSVSIAVKTRFMRD